MVAKAWDQEDEEPVNDFLGVVFFYGRTSIEAIWAPVSGATAWDPATCGQGFDDRDDLRNASLALKTGMLYTIHCRALSGIRNMYNDVENQNILTKNIILRMLSLALPASAPPDLASARTCELVFESLFTRSRFACVFSVYVGSRCRRSTPSSVIRVVSARRRPG